MFTFIDARLPPLKFSRTVRCDGSSNQADPSTADSYRVRNALYPTIATTSTVSVPIVSPGFLNFAFVFLK